MTVNSEKVVFGLAISGRYAVGLPLVLVAVDLRDGGDRKLKLANVNWPPPAVEMTPTVSATILKGGFEELGFNQLSNCDCRIFTDGPIACNDSGVRQANLELPDVDWTRVPLIREAHKRDDVSRTSLEFFHALLWRERFSDDNQLEAWRLGFQVKDDSGKSPNIFEVCLGQRAREFMLQKRRGSKPHSKDALKCLKERLKKFEIDCSLIEAPNTWETDAYIRALMLLSIGLEYRSEHNKSRFRTYGKRVVFTDGLMSEGEVLGIACAKFAPDSAQKVYELIQNKSTGLVPSDWKPKVKFPTERLWVYFANETFQSQVDESLLALPTIYNKLVEINDVIFIASRSADESLAPFVESCCLVGRSRKRSKPPGFDLWKVTRGPNADGCRFQVTSDMPELAHLDAFGNGFTNPEDKPTLSGDESSVRPQQPSTNATQFGCESQWDVDMAASDYVCVLDRENLRSVLKEEFLPRADLWNWRRSSGEKENYSNAKVWASLKAGQAVLLVSYSGWKWAEHKVKNLKNREQLRQKRSGAPTSIFPVAFVRIGKNSKKPKISDSQNELFEAFSKERIKSFKRLTKKGKEQICGVNVRFDRFAIGSVQGFPNAITEKGLFLTTDEFRKLINPPS